MKWTIKPKPKEGDRRVKTKFAFFPKKIGDKRIWLEKYLSIQKYQRMAIWVTHSHGLFYEYQHLDSKLMWVEVERKIK